MQQLIQKESIEILEAFSTITGDQWSSDLVSSTQWAVKPLEGWQVLLRLFKGFLPSSSNWGSSPRFQFNLMNGTRETKHGQWNGASVRNIWANTRLKMIEANLFPAKSLSLLLRRPDHPVLVTLFQACSANALHLGCFSLFQMSGWQFLPKLWSVTKTCARTGLGSAVPASRLAFRTSACNTSITWSVNIGQRNSFKQTSHFSIGKSWPVFRGSFLQPPCWRRPCVERWQRLSARSHHLCWPASWVDSRSTAWTRTPNQTCHVLLTERERSH